MICRLIMDADLNKGGMVRIAEMCVVAFVDAMRICRHEALVRLV